MNMFLAPSIETEERRELEERAGGEAGMEERREGEIIGRREMFLMTLESDTRTATQLLLQDFSLSLYISPAFLSLLLLLLLLLPLLLESL